MYDNCTINYNWLDMDYQFLYLLRHSSMGMMTPWQELACLVSFLMNDWLNHKVVTEYVQYLFGKRQCDLIYAATIENLGIFFF